MLLIAVKEAKLSLKITGFIILWPQHYCNHPVLHVAYPWMVNVKYYVLYITLFIFLLVFLHEKLVVLGDDFVDIFLAFCNVIVWKRENWQIKTRCGCVGSRWICGPKQGNYLDFFTEKLWLLLFNYGID